MSAFSADRPLRLGVLLSGAGSTLHNVLERIHDGRLTHITIPTVVSSRATVRGVELARAAGLPVHVIRTRDFADTAAFSAAIAGTLDDARVDLVVLAGFLCFWAFPPRYAGRVLNIHPALLPAFGGRGMFGHHVHAAVLAARVTESGCTVHLADDQYDHGPIIAQARVPVLPDDTPDTLAARVGIAERELYPSVIQRVADEGLDALKRQWDKLG